VEWNVSDEQEAPPLTGKAKGWANLKPWTKGQSGNKSGRPKDLAKFGDILMKEFYRTVAANLGGKTVKKSQGEIVARQMVKNAISKGPASLNILLKFVEAHEARQAAAELAKAKKVADGSVEIDWDAEKEELYQRVMNAANADALQVTAPKDK
jgi:hypothetical protein